MYMTQRVECTRCGVCTHIYILEDVHKLRERERQRERERERGGADTVIY